MEIHLCHPRIGGCLFRIWDASKEIHRHRHDATAVKDNGGNEYEGLSQSEAKVQESARAAHGNAQDVGVPPRPL